MQVCSTSHLFHYFFTEDPDQAAAIVEQGIRPLSDFPDSPRWRQFEAEMPGFYEKLYDMMAQPILGMPYENSGVFVTPIDFRLVPGTYLHDKPRFRLPVDRFDPRRSVLTYVLDEQRTAVPLSSEHLALTAEIWNADLVRQWFARDTTKVFFYVPQVAAYQGRVEVEPGDYEPHTPEEAK